MPSPPQQRTVDEMRKLFLVLPQKQKQRGATSPSSSFREYAGVWAVTDDEPSCFKAAISSLDVSRRRPSAFMVLVVVEQCSMFPPKLAKSRCRKGGKLSSPAEKQASERAGRIPNEFHFGEDDDR